MIHTNIVFPDSLWTPRKVQRFKDTKNPKIPGTPGLESRHIVVGTGIGIYVYIQLHTSIDLEPK